MKLRCVVRSFRIRVLTLAACALAGTMLQSRAQEPAGSKQRQLQPAAGGDSANVCRFLEDRGLDANSSALKTLNAEHMLGRICNPNYSASCSKGDVPVSVLFAKGISKDDPTLKELLSDTWTLWASTVDIDNDGNDEIRIFETAGTAHCTYSYFFKRDRSGAYHLLEEGNYPVFAEEGRFCDGNLSFIRYQGQVFSLESYTGIERVRRGTGPNVDQVCDFSKQIHAPLNLTFDHALSKDDVIDLNAKWHFISIGNWYSDGKDGLLCVQTATEKYALWNPRTDTVSAPSGNKCEPEPGFRLIEPTEDGPIKISSGGSVSGRCGAMFDFYYTVEFPDGSEGSFYVIQRLEEPQQNNEFWCGSPGREGKKFQQVFAPIDADLVNVGDNKLLLYSNSQAKSGMCDACWSTFARPTLLLLKAAPETVWSSEGNVFIVPKEMFDANTAHQSDSVLTQYQAMMKIIAEPPAAEIAP